MPTVISELSDPSNRDAAFAYLPIFAWLGGVIGPLIGGLLASSSETTPSFGPSNEPPFPYCTSHRSCLNRSFLLPNIVISSLLVAEFLLILLFTKESHTTLSDDLGRTAIRSRGLFRRTQQAPASSRDDGDDDDQVAETATLLPSQPGPAQINVHGFNFLTVDLVIIIGTSAISHFCASAYNKLLIDFLSSPFPIGRNLSAKETGYVWSGTALMCIVVQALAFTKIAKLCGHARFYSLTMAVLTISWLYTPFIGLHSGTAGLWIQLSLGVTLRKIADISNFTCWLLLVYLFIYDIELMKASR